MKLLIAAGIRIVEILFFAGWAGSVLVIAMSLTNFIFAYQQPDTGPESEETDTPEMDDQP
jgi:hypothetical protein